MTTPDLSRRLSNPRSQEREAARTMVAAIKDEDLRALFSGLDKCEVSGDASRLAALLIARHCTPGSGKFQRAFMRDLWCQRGDALRRAVGDDRALIEMLRAIFSPRMVGGPLRLWRGEMARNRRYRNYGLSWTSSIEVARGFAEGGWMRAADGGTVVLETVVPEDAIIAVVDDHVYDAGEREYIVDRRRLGKVVVVGRYVQKID